MGSCLKGCVVTLSPSLYCLFFIFLVPMLRVLFLPAPLLSITTAPPQLTDATRSVGTWESSCPLCPCGSGLVQYNHKQTPNTHNPVIHLHSLRSLHSPGTARQCRCAACASVERRPHRHRLANQSTAAATAKRPKSGNHKNPCSAGNTSSLPCRLTSAPAPMGFLTPAAAHRQNRSTLASVRNDVLFSCCTCWVPRSEAVKEFSFKYNEHRTPRGEQL
jgi:hypothetical protein